MVLREAHYPCEEELDAGAGDLVSQHVLGVPAAEASLMAEDRVWAREACGVEKAVPCLELCSGVGGAAATVIGSSGSL